MGRHTDYFIKEYKKGNVPEATLKKMAEFKEELEKLSFNLPSGYAKAAIIPLLGLTAGIGHAVAGQYFESKDLQDLEESREPAFKSMLSRFPELKEKRALARQYFDSLFHFAPAIALEPQAAGSYVRMGVYYHAEGGPQVDVLKNVSDIQKNYFQARRSFDTLDAIVQPLLKTLPSLSPKLTFINDKK